MRRGMVGFAFAVAVSACAAPYEMLREAHPNPLFGARTFSLEPIAFNAMLVGDKPVAQYTATKTEEQRASFRADEEAMNGTFAASVTGRAGPLQIVMGPPPDAGAFIIRPQVVRYEPGFYSYVASRATEVELRVQVLNAQGQLVDELMLRSTVYATLGNPSAGGRMREAGDNLGWRLSEYLRHRTQHP